MNKPKIYVSKSIEDEVERAIISEMEISDDASTELRRIRRQMANEKQSIKNKLNEIVTSSKYAKILQDTVVTEIGRAHV